MLGGPGIPRSCRTRDRLRPPGRAQTLAVVVSARSRGPQSGTARLIGGRTGGALSDAGDMARLVELRNSGGVYVTDGGGRATAARRPVRGAEPIARLAI